MLSALDPFVDQEDGQFDALVGEDPSAAATFDYADESQAQLTWAFPPVVGPYDLCRAHVSNTANSWLSDLNAFNVEPPPLTFTEQAVARRRSTRSCVTATATRSPSRSGSTSRCGTPQ